MDKFLKRFDYFDKYSRTPYDPRMNLKKNKGV